MIFHHHHMTLQQKELHIKVILWHVTTNPIQYQTYHLTRIQNQVLQIILCLINMTPHTSGIKNEDDRWKKNTNVYPRAEKNCGDDYIMFLIYEFHVCDTFTAGNTDLSSNNILESRILSYPLSTLVEQNTESTQAKYKLPQISIFKKWLKCLSLIQFFRVLIMNEQINYSKYQTYSHQGRYRLLHSKYSIFQKPCLLFN